LSPILGGLPPGFYPSFRCLSVSCRSCSQFPEFAIRFLLRCATTRKIPQISSAAALIESLHDYGVCHSIKIKFDDPGCMAGRFSGQGGVVKSVVLSKIPPDKLKKILTWQRKYKYIKLNSMGHAVALIAGVLQPD